MSQKNHIRVTVILVLIGLALWLWGVDDPFVGLYNANNNYLALAAKNFLRFGFSQLHFFPTYFAGFALPEQVTYYLHHPTLFFLLATIPFAIFGEHNWVAHAMTFVFTALSMAMIYILTAHIWNRKVARWALVLAVLFPMTTFFWKQMFFEQVTMFFNLIVVYFMVRYIEKPQGLWLFGIFCAALVSILNDWLGAYLVFPMVFLLFTKYHAAMRRILFVYVLAVAIGVGFFLGSVYILTGSYQDLLTAVSDRSVGSELFRLPYWWLRLSLVTAIRFLLYFTPFSVLSFLYLFTVRKTIEPHGYTFSHYILLFLFIWGLVNIVFLPTATWGHTYFLFNFVPFFAVSGAIMMSMIMKKPVLLYMSLAGIVLFSLSVNYLKMQQIEKQYWKYLAAHSVHLHTAPYEPIAVLHFPGDVLEQYFYHPTVPIREQDFQSWLTGFQQPEISHILISCVSECTQGDHSRIQALERRFSVTEIRVPGGTAWLVRRNPGSALPNYESDIMPLTGNGAETHVVTPLSVYRLIRDFIGVHHL